MKRSSTPTHSFALPFVYERYVERFVLTYKQGESVVLTKTEKDFGESIVANGNVLAVSLTQEETNLFERGEAKVELKVLTKNDKVLISDTIEVPVYEVLNDEVFE